MSHCRTSMNIYILSDGYHAVQLSSTVSGSLIQLNYSCRKQQFASKCKADYGYDRSSILHSSGALTLGRNNYYLNLLLLRKLKLEPLKLKHWLKMNAHAIGISFLWLGDGRILVFSNTCVLETQDSRLISWDLIMDHGLNLNRRLNWKISLSRQLTDSNLKVVMHWKDDQSTSKDIKCLGAENGKLILRFNWIISYSHFGYQLSEVYNQDLSCFNKFCINSNINCRTKKYVHWVNLFTIGSWRM